MAKIKITKQQAIMLENLNKPKVLKITESQYKAILKLEGLDESAVIPKIANSLKGKDKIEFIQNVHSETKIKGIMEESEELWKEFVNELYGLHESSSNIYEKLIKLMEVSGFVENRKLSKLKFEGDKNMAKNVILGGLNKLHETGSPYSAMEMMENEYERIKQSLKQQLNQEPSNKFSDEEKYKEIKRRRDIELQRRKESGDIKSEQSVNEYNGDEPWNEPDQPEDPMVNINKDWEVLQYDKDKNYITLKNKNNNKTYALNIDIIPEDLFYSEEFGDRIDLDTPMDSNNWKMIKANRSKMVIANFVSNNLKSLISPENYGEGDPEELFMDGKSFVKLPESLDELNNTIKEDFNLGEGYTHFAIFKSNGKIADGWDYSDLYNEDSKTYDNESIKYYVKSDLLDNYPENKPSEFKIATRKALEKNGINPSDTNNWYKTGDDAVVEFDNTIYEAVNSLKKKPQEDEELEESTTTGSALGGISLVMPLGSKPEDYIIKKPVKENAFDRTQWAGGEFVEFDDCTKLNNNKEAQKGKCSVGAIDNVVKTKKTATNVNAPSLGKKAK
jgi:hypothetical protein